MILRSRGAQSAGLAAACILCFSALLLVNRTFYFNDDFQLYFAPMFTEIARLLGEGVFPLATDRSWNGGAIAGEFQYAIFNPFSLLLMFAFGHIADTALAAAAFAIAHYTVYCVGTFVLALSLGYTTRASVVTAVLAVSSGFLLYFSAVSWIPGVTSIAWAPWCLAALILVYRDPRCLALGSLATAMPLLCGWPFTVLGLAVMIGVGLVAGLVVGLPRGRLACVALSALLGAGLCLPAILPVAAYVAEGARSVAGKVTWMADLPGLFAFGFPTYASRFSGLDLRQTIHAPICYVGWFLPLLLVNSGRRLVSDPRSVALTVAAVTFAAMSQLPAVWQFQWSMRHLPMLHFCLAMLGGWCLSTGADRPWRVAPSALALLAPAALAIVTTPELLFRHVLALACLAALTAAVILLQRRGRDGVPLLLASHVAILLALVAAQPTNDLLPRWDLSTRPKSAADGGDLVLALYRPGEAGFPARRAFWDEIPVGNTGLFSGLRTINGYSPLLPKGLQDTFCQRYLCANEPDSIFRFLEPDALTGLPMIDLARVTRVIAQKGDLADTFERATAGRWTVAARRSESVEFRRAEPLTAAAGRIGWMSSPLDIRALGSDARRVTFEIGTAPAADVDVLFARPFRPGYRASLEGVPLRLVAHRGVFPMVRVPAGASGRLVVEDWPAGLTAGLWAAAGTAAFLLAWTLLAGLARQGRNGRLPAKPKPA